MGIFKAALQKGFWAALTASTMLCTGCLKISNPPPDAEETVMRGDWEYDVRNEVVAAFNNDDPLPPCLAQPISKDSIDESFLYIEPCDTIHNLYARDPLSDYVDVDDLLTIAKQKHKSRIYYDKRFESVLGSPAQSTHTPHYMAFSVEELQRINFKTKKDAQKLKLPDSKILLRFYDLNNACNSTVQQDFAALIHPENTVITVNTAALDQNDRETLEYVTDHELGHSVTLPLFKNTLLYLAYVANDTSRVFECSIKLLQARRNWEYRCDSLAVTLSDNPKKMSGFFIRQDRQRTLDNAVLIHQQSDTTRNSASLIFDIMNNNISSVQARSTQDDIFSTHPSDANRIRNMALVRHYNECKNELNKQTLQDMMPKSQPIGWMPFNYELAAYQPR